MDFRRAFAASAGLALPLASGAGLVLALQGRLYACALVLALIGVWSAAHARWGGRALAWRPPPPPPPAGPAESELRLVSGLLDQTPAPLIISHPDGVLRAGNRAARALFGVDDRLTPPPPDLAAALGQGDPGRRLTVRLETGEGPHVYAVSIADLIDRRGPMRLAILVDIQPEIRAAEAVAQRDLMQVLSHEIMNALTPVASLAATARDLLLDEASPSAVQALDAVATLARRADGLTRFVEAYRSLARLPEPVLAKVSLGALFEEVARLFRGRWTPSGVCLRLLKPDPDIVLDLDLDLMVHALANVLSNGAEAALSAGRGAPTVTLAAEIRDDATRLTVEDNGAGVLPAAKDTIFRPFFTTKPEGSGVGLSFARQVALSHGGSLTLAAPEPGRGARFVLSLSTYGGGRF
jgi:two-component system, NtrC family, nitrogen regulation sensor histidine kinase NtrY